MTFYANRGQVLVFIELTQLECVHPTLESVSGKENQFISSIDMSWMDSPPTQTDASQTNWGTIREQLMRAHTNSPIARIRWTGNNFGVSQEDDTLFFPDGPMECHMRSASWSIGSEPTERTIRRQVPIVETTSKFLNWLGEWELTKGRVVWPANICLLRYP